MKSFNIMEVHLKIGFLGRLHEKTKRGALDNWPILGVLGKKEGVGVFEGGDNPVQTMTSLVKVQE